MFPPAPPFVNFVTLLLTFNAKTQRRKDAEVQSWTFSRKVVACRQITASGRIFPNYAFVFCFSVLASLRLCDITGTPMNENEISKIIVDAAIEVHRELGGPGLIEDLYEEVNLLLSCGSASRPSGKLAARFAFIE